jgi:nucleoside-diphosphate kinase
MERTLAIIKPDAVEARRVGAILSRIEQEGFTILGLRWLHMTRAEAEGFYAVHRERGFFSELTAFMSSGPCLAIALAAPEAITRWRAVMGATDPAKADAGTIRREHGRDIQCNATHGSDAPATARTELAYFFPEIELVSRR